MNKTKPLRLSPYAASGGGIKNLSRPRCVKGSAFFPTFATFPYNLCALHSVPFTYLCYSFIDSMRTDLWNLFPLLFMSWIMQCFALDCILGIQYAPRIMCSPCVYCGLVHGNFRPNTRGFTAIAGVMPVKNCCNIKIASKISDNVIGSEYDLVQSHLSRYIYIYIYIWFICRYIVCIFL